MSPTADAGQRPVVIAYDGSDQAQGAIVEAGRELGAGRRAVVLTVRDAFDQVPLAGIGSGAMLDPATLSAIQEAATREADTVAEEGAQLARQAGFDAEARVEVAASPAQKIVAIAEELGAGVIVVGSRGRTGLSKVLLGSVASGVAQQSGCSVLIVRGGTADEPQ